MTRKSLSLFATAYFIAIDLFWLGITQNPSGMLGQILNYPAQGEEQASANLFRMLFLVLPTLLLAGLMLAYLLKQALFARIPERMRRIFESGILGVLACGYVYAIATSFQSGYTDGKFLLFISVTLLVYLTIYMLIAQLGRKFGWALS